MRYKKVQIVHQVVIDDEIDDLESIRNLLQNICESHINVSIEYQVPTSDSPVLWKRVRINSVEKEVAKISIFFGKCINKNTIEIKNIIFVGIVTDRSGILSGKSQVTTYDFLDLSVDKHDKQ